MKKAIIIALVICVSGTMAWAKEKERGRAKMRDVKDRVEMLKTMRLSEELGLNEERTVKFYSIMKKHREDRRKIMDRMHELTQELEQMIERKKDEGKIKGILDKVEGVLGERCRAEEGFRKELKEFLSVEEQAKLVVAMPRIEHEIREMAIVHRGAQAGKPPHEFSPEGHRPPMPPPEGPPPP